MYLSDVAFDTRIVVLIKTSKFNVTV